MEIIVLSVMIVAVAAVAAYVAVSARKRNGRLQDEIISLEKEKAAALSTLIAKDEAMEEMRKTHEAALAELRRVNDAALERTVAQHKSDLDTMKEQFKAAAAEIAASNTKEFKEQSASRIADLLAPIKEKFTEFDKTVRESHTESIKQNTELSTSIKLVMEQSRQVGQEARNLADALSGRSKVQGDFGEMLLKDILKNSGLQEGIHFISQGVLTDDNGHEIKNEDGRTMIPDTIVYYPDDTMVIVDSKVSLTAFNNFMAATSVEQRERYAKEHVESVRRHIDELKSKDYAAYIPTGKCKVDYNIMFVPVEAAFQLMLEKSPLLWQTAKDNNVLIVSQMTLVIVLNMIQMSWRQAEQEANIEQVYKTASELMSQLQAWMSAYVSVGENIERTVRAYNESKMKLVDSNQSVIKKIGRLEALGVSPKRSRGKVKTSARRTGPESVIPAALSPVPSGPDDPE